MDKHLPPIIYVYIGNKLPKYAFASLAGVKSRNNNEVILLTNARNFHKVSPEIKVVQISDFYDSKVFEYFKQNTVLDVNFRKGFWIHTAERFFVIKQYVQHFNYSNFYHAELDVMVFNLNNLSELLDKVGKGLFVPRDSKDRAIASLIYCNDISVMAECCEYILFNSTYGNEMAIISQFMVNNPSSTFSLPSESTLNQISKSPEWDFVASNICGGIFDAASMGQWLFGIDPRNSPKVVSNHFINENWHCDPTNLNFAYDFSESSLNVSDLSRMNTQTNVYCLHIHSKINSKLENIRNFEKLLAQAQKVNPTVISRNYRQKLRNISTTFSRKCKKALSLIMN